MNNSATIVAAALDSSKLEQSINELVSTVAAKTKEMADNFTGEVKRMEDAVKNLGNIKIDSGGTADGGSSRRTSKQKEEETQVKATTQAYKEQKSVIGELAMSFDNINTAITKSNSKLVAKFDVTEQQKVQQLEAQRTAIEDKIVARQIEIDESYRSQLATLSKTRSELESKANLTSKEQADLKHVTTEWERINKIVRDISSRPIVAADDPTGSIGRLQQQLVETNKQLDESRKRIQEMNFERAKMYDGSLSGLVQNAQATMKYQNDTLKKSFEDLLKKPTHDVDEMRAKMERLQTFLNNIKPLNIFSPELIANGERAINKLKNEIQKFNDKPTKQAFADALKLPDRTQSEIITKINRIRDAIKGVEGTKIVSETEIARANSLIDSLRDKWSKLYNAPKDRQLRIDFADALKMPTNNIDEIAAKLMRLQHILQEMRGMEVLSPQQIANGNQQISALLSKLEAEMSLRQQINAVEQADMQNAQKRIELEAKYGEEVAKAAAIANEWLQKNKEAAILNKEGTFVIQDPKAGQTVGQSIEAQLLAYKAINGELNLELEVQKAIQNTVESIERAEQRRIALTQGGNATSNKSFADYEDLRAAIAAVLRVRESEVSLANSEDASYKALSLTLKQLKQAYESLNASQRKSENADALIASIHETQRAMQEIQKQMSRPVNLASALALPEKTIDDISYKVQMLRAYAQGINIETNAGNAELRRVMSTIEGLNEGLKNAQKTTKQITIESNNIKFDNIAKMPTEGLKQVGAKIKEVKQYINELKNQPIVDEKNLKRAEALYDRLIKQSQKLNDTKGTHSNVNDALNVRVKTLDEIAKKMQRLQAIRQNLDINKQKTDIDRINAALGELKKQQDGVLQRNANMIKSNNTLGRSWNYMKNRLAFYFTVGASTQFVKSLIDIRGQYELLERSIGILIDSAQNGSQIFAELNSMAIKSPFTTMELGAAAKQLVAYDVAAKDVVDTTRRLADMAAAVGIPIERLTYALGQIKAYGYLNARDARMFANAGIPLVKELADRYTELEGRLVSTSDVYDRIKKKAISYEDVMATVNKMTDEGGKFFNFQEKAADTLKVRIANLTLAWNNMLNEMGKSNQGVLAGGLKMLKDVFEHWRDIHNTILSIITTLGVLKATQVAVLTITAMHIKKNITLWTALEFAIRKSIGAAVVNNLRSIGSLLARFANPLSIAAAVVTALGIAIGKAVLDYRDLIAANEAFNKSISDNAKENIESIEKFFEDYKKQLSNIGGLNNADQEKLWERIQEEIEKTTKNAEDYIRVLNDVKNVSSRIRLGEDILEQSKTIQGELQRLADSGTFSIGGGFANDSAAENLQNYQKALNEIRQEYGSVNAAIEAHTMKSRKLMADYTTQRDEVRAELNDFVSKLNNAYMPEILGQSDDVRIQLANVRSFAESLRDAFIATEEGSKIGADGIVLLNNAIDKWITKQGVANNLIVNANGDFDEQRARIEENKTAWEEFFRYVSKKDREYLDAAIKTNNIGSDEVKKIWDKAAEEMSKRATTSYDLIQDQIAQLRNTPDIVINVVYRNEKEKLDKDQEEFQNKYIRPKGWSALSPDEYLEQEKANREKYGTLMRKQGEDTVEYEKRISDERKANLALQKKNGDIIEENKNKTDAYSEAVTKQAKKEKAAADERLKFIKEVEDAGGYDFSTKSENAAARKAQKQAESELAKALKDELSTIDKVRSIYKDLTKEGMSHADAVERATKGWNETINAINRVLQKNGLQKLDLSKFAGVENPRELLNTLQSQLEELVRRGASTSEIRVLQTKIQTVSVEADKYDLTKITKGLNNELDRLKDEYELAVSLDADPELGNMFADWMGIDVNDLPRTASEYAERASKILNSKLKDLGAKTELPNVLNITDDDMRAFEENKTFTDKQLEIIKKAVEAARGFQKKETEDRIKDWDKLLEKYAEYETKVSKIQNDAVKERVTFAQQFGSEDDKSMALNLQTHILAATDPQEKQKLIQQLQELVKSIAGDDKAKLNIVTSIDNSETKGLAKASFEEFQKSPEWITATGELSGMTNKAIDGLIASLEKYKKSAKNLDPKQIKNINNALKNLYKEQRKNNPFGAIANMLDKTKERMADVEPEMESIMSDIIALEKEIGGGKATEEQIKTLDDLKKRWQALAKIGEISAGEWVESLMSVYGAIKGAISLFDDLAKAIGGANASDVEKLFGILDKAAQGAQIGASFGGYGAAIGAVVGAATGVIETFADVWSGNADITSEVEKSTRAIKHLELAYIDLQQAVDRAYGTAVVGAKHATLANKELQLAELQRQIQLEKSRDSKYRDEDKILDLQKQYKELFYEIQNGYTEIVDDLMGTDVASFAENLVSSMIDAFKQGEDYMDVFNKKFDEMIDNMIMKSIVSRVVSQYLNQIWDSIDQRINDRSQEERNEYAKAQDYAEKVRGMSDEELRAEITKQRTGNLFDLVDVWNTLTDKDIEEYRKVVAAEEIAAKKRLDAASEFTNSDVDYIMGQITEVMPELGQKLKEILGEYYKFGESSETQLGALQQGIQGITEDTAGALEAYMNGVSQQVYLQSDLLTQIRDAVVSFDLDVQVATMSQILLQLQSSYTVQMSIQGILEGTLNPSGQGFRVELIS